MEEETQQLAILSRELGDRRALLARNAQLEIIASTMDLRGLEALHSYKTERVEHLKTRQEAEKQARASKKEITDLTAKCKLLQRQLDDQKEMVKKLRTSGGQAIVCVQCSTLTTVDREKYKHLRLLDAVVAREKALNADFEEYMKMALDPSPKERCPCGYVKFIDRNCQKCDYPAPPPTPAT